MKIKIKEPCDADWNKMKIGVQSRHYELCVKNVMDFTQMTRQEIIMYLFNNQNQSTSGRIRGGPLSWKYIQILPVHLLLLNQKKLKKLLFIQWMEKLF